MFIGLQNDGTHARLTNPSQLAADIGVFLNLFATLPAAAQTAEDRFLAKEMGLEKAYLPFGSGGAAKLKEKCFISKTVTDEPKRSGDSRQPAARRARRSRGKSKARSRTSTR